MSVRHFIVATAGHVDHGKSALVKALTGTDPDRLPEEKARGITIDLGFAHLELGELSLGIVDVPGHEDFVKNMVAGVGSIDLALFIVAADDGWMPQTEEHLQILTYLGVRHAVVALTKIDLVEGREAETVGKLREQLRGTPFEAAPIVGTSVITGRGIEELKSALAATLAAVPPPRDIGKPRLPIDRVFTLRGIGTVVTGTLSGGVLKRNQPVVLQPSGKAGRVRSLQTHSRDAEQVSPGTRTALNVPDFAGSADGSDGAVRGAVITMPELGGPSDTLDVLLEKSPRLLNTKSPAARPLKDGAIVRVHHGSGNFPARMLLLDGEPLLPGGRAFAQLRFEEPVFALGGDHFIVRDWAEQATLAGGIVLDAEPDRRQFRTEAHRALLERRAASPSDSIVWTATQLARDRAVRRAGLLVKSRFAADEIAAAIAKLTTEQKVFGTAEWIADGVWWQSLRQQAGEAVRAAHRQHPERVGLDVAELRRAVEAQLPDAALFEVLLADLCRSGFAQTGTAIRDTAHRPALPEKLQAAGAKVRAALSAKPFEPPARKELAPDALAQQALRFLLDTGEAVEIAPDLVMSAENFTRAREAIAKFLRERRQASASDLRQLLNTNRRVIIPLLERLDRDGVTRREGDARVLR